MARKPRLFLQGYTYHITQRGNNRTAIFIDQNDYNVFLKMLKLAKEKHPCMLYSYCLMPNHFHLLASPIEKDNISLLIKLLGAKYVHYFNKKYKRTGTLWEGRFKASLIDKERYFIACIKYIEMNPVRAKIVVSPELYPWSSYCLKLTEKTNSLIDMDDWYYSLGNTPQKRAEAYRNLFYTEPAQEEIQKIRRFTQKNWVLGEANFLTRLQKITKIKLNRPIGRPNKDEKIILTPLKLT